MNRRLRVHAGPRARQQPAAGAPTDDTRPHGGWRRAQPAGRRSFISASCNSCLPVDQPAQAARTTKYSHRSTHASPHLAPANRTTARETFIQYLSAELPLSRLFSCCDPPHEPGPSSGSCRNGSVRPDGSGVIRRRRPASGQRGRAPLAATRPSLVQRRWEPTPPVSGSEPGDEASLAPQRVLRCGRDDRR